MLTIPLGTKELRLAGASVATTDVQDPNNPSSISIEFHEPAATPAAEPSDTPLKTMTPRPSGGLLRRPIVILTAAAGALGIVLAVSIVLSRAKPASPKTPDPAPELFARPVAPPVAPSPTPLAPPVAPVPPDPPAALPSAAPAAAAALPDNQPSTEKKRPARKHHKQIVDKNGIAIPSD